MGCSYVFVNSLGVDVSDSGWLSWARFAPAGGVRRPFPVMARFRLRGLVLRFRFEHAVDHVAAPSAADDGGVVVFALFAFALVMEPRRAGVWWIDERGLPQRVLEAFVAPHGGLVRPLMLVPDWPVTGDMPA